MSAEMSFERLALSVVFIFLLGFICGFGVAGAGYQEQVAEGWCEEQGGTVGPHNYCMVGETAVNYPDWAPFPKSWDLHSKKKKVLFRIKMLTLT